MEDDDDIEKAALLASDNTCEAVWGPDQNLNDENDLDQREDKRLSSGRRILVLCTGYLKQLILKPRKLKPFHEK